MKRLNVVQLTAAALLIAVFALAPAAQSDVKGLIFFQFDCGHSLTC